MTSENPTGDDNSAQRAEGKANQHSNESKPIIPPAIGPTKSETPPCCFEQNPTTEKEKHWLDYVEAGMGALGLLVLIVYTIFTALMYCANKKAADAAKSAADTADATLKAAQAQFALQNRAYLIPVETNLKGGGTDS